VAKPLRAIHQELKNYQKDRWLGRWYRLEDMEAIPKAYEASSLEAGHELEVHYISDVIQYDFISSKLHGGGRRSIFDENLSLEERQLHLKYHGFMAA
jgi:hypothetical protein